MGIFKGKKSSPPPKSRGLEQVPIGKKLAKEVVKDKCGKGACGHPEHRGS